MVGAVNMQQHKISSWGSISTFCKKKFIHPWIKWDWNLPIWIWISTLTDSISMKQWSLCVFQSRDTEWLQKGFGYLKMSKCYCIRSLNQETFIIAYHLVSESFLGPLMTSLLSEQPHQPLKYPLVNHYTYNNQ